MQFSRTSYLLDHQIASYRLRLFEIEILPGAVLIREADHHFLKLSSNHFASILAFLFLSLSHEYIPSPPTRLKMDIQDIINFLKRIFSIEYAKFYGGKYR